ncbi:MAG: ABC transporter ATP-binding protein, partial [Flavobacteriales bacterium]|nr:ABC transporter ATP-binding protein [Flavobacteriales bacterium]
MKGFFRIIRYLQGYKTEVLLNLLTNLFFVLFNLLSLLLFIPFLDLLFSDNPTVVTALPKFSLSKEYFQDFFAYHMSQRIVEGGPLSALAFICGLTVLMFFLKNLSRYLAYLSLARIRQGISRDIRRDIYHKVVSLPLSFFSDERKGDIMARNTSDVTEVDMSVIGSLEMMMRDPLNIILSFIAMTMISPQLTLFSLILMPISGFIIGRISKSLKRTSKKGQDKQGELFSFLEETLGGLRIIKAFNAEEAMHAGFAKLNESFRRISIRLLNKRDLASPLSEFLGAVVMVGVVWYGG